MPSLAPFTHSLTHPQVALVNLDPANDVLPYSPDVDVSDLVDLAAVMGELHLGPNGGEGGGVVVVVVEEWCAGAGVGGSLQSLWPAGSEPCHMPTCW